jgi:hypothetical protein
MNSKQEAKEGMILENFQVILFPKSAERNVEQNFTSASGSLQLKFHGKEFNQTIFVFNVASIKGIFKAF